jgi:hypothetical protein
MNRAHATRDSWHPQTKQDRDAILQELEAILASPHFCNSKRYPTLLRYIVENTLAGRLDVLKERTLGVEVFDRPPTYDTNTDTVVRYTAGEVRKRLLLYYSEHGNNASMRISLPAGSYVAEFVHGHEAHEEAGEESELSPAFFHDSELVHHSSLEPQELTAAALAITLDESGHPIAAHAPVSTRLPSRWPLRWTLGLATAVLLLGAAASILWWRTGAGRPQSAVDVFWAPVLHDQRSVMVCTGSSVFEPKSYSGVTTAGKDIDYTFVSMQIASSIAQVAATMEHAGVATQLVPSATTALPDLREHSVALLGGYNNQWTMRLVQPLHYHLVPGSEEVIQDQTQPQNQWRRDESLPYSSADDYALVARFRDSTIDGWVVVMAGLGRNGTEAAAQFVTTPHYMELLRDRVGSGFANRNIEAVLKVSVIDGKTGAPSLQAVYSW